MGEILGAVVLAGDHSKLEPIWLAKPIMILAEGDESKDGQVVIDEKQGKFVKILENVEPEAHYDLFAKRLAVKKQSAVVGSFGEQRRIWGVPPN